MLAAERWLRERLSTGGVEVESSFLTRWDEQTQQVVVVLGELVDFLAGRIVTLVGVPEIWKTTIEATASPSDTRLLLRQLPSTGYHFHRRQRQPGHRVDLRLPLRQMALRPRSIPR